MDIFGEFYQYHHSLSAWFAIDPPLDKVPRPPKHKKRFKKRQKQRRSWAWSNKKLKTSWELQRWKEYNDHLNSEKWKAFRRSIFAERGRACERCHSTAKGHRHLHHDTYVNFGNEQPADVRILCVSCHKIVHLQKREQQRRK